MRIYDLPGDGVEQQMYLTKISMELNIDIQVLAFYKNRTTVILRPFKGQDKYTRINGSGKRLNGVCWQAYADVIKRILNDYIEVSFTSKQLKINHFFEYTNQFRYDKNELCLCNREEIENNPNKLHSYNHGTIK
jgi:hypothetical protein